MDDRLSVERIWFSNTLLLGFDAVQSEKKYRVAFSHDMFKNPNVKGMEVVLHFLLCQLYTTRMNELLKFVWPINDQNQGKQYRQIVANLLQELKDKLDLPPIVSTLQSCSGKRFYDLLWKLSCYALQTTMQKKFPDYPVPSFPAVDANTSLQKLMDLASATKLHIARQSRMFVSHAQRAVVAQENWKQFDKTMYDEYTALTEELATLKKEQAELATKFDLSHINNTESQEIRRKQVDDVRQMWQVAEDFNTQVTKNKEIYADVLAGNSYPYQLNASDLHIAKIPEELAGVAAPLLLPTTNDPQAPQFTLDGLITLFTSALSLLSLSLPPASPPLPICTEAPRLAEWAKTQTSQLAAIQAFESELTNQAVAWRTELQEAMEVRASIDLALHNRTDDDRLRMEPLPPPASYLDDLSTHDQREMTTKEFGFASPASRAPKQDVLEKLANSVKRVALRGSRTFAAISNELLSPDFGSEDSQNFSISTMSTINPDIFFAPPSTPAPAVHQSTSKRRTNTTQRQPRQSIMNAPLYNKPPQPTPTTTTTTSRQPTKSKPVPKPFTSATKPPHATSNDNSALNLSSVFSQQKPDLPSTKNKTLSTRSTLAPTTNTTTTSSTSSSPLNPSVTKKSTQKRTNTRPSAMDLLVHDLAAYIGGSEMLGSAEDDVDEERKGGGDRRDRSDNKGKEERASKPKPSGFRTGPTSHAKTPKKKLAWAETPDNGMHSHTDTLEAIEGTAFYTTKQLPRTPLLHERETKSHNHATPKAVMKTQPVDTSPSNFFGDNSNNNSNNNSLFSDDVEWNQFINNHNPSPKTSKNSPNKNSTSNYNNILPVASNTKPNNIPSHINGKNHTSPQKNNNKSHHTEPMDSMDYDTGIDSPMHMTDWLSSAPSSTPFDEPDIDPLFPSFSTNLSFSNDLPKDHHSTRAPQRNMNHSIFATPADEPWDFR